MPLPEDQSRSTNHEHHALHACDAVNNHAAIVTNRAIKIRKPNEGQRLDLEVVVSHDNSGGGPTGGFSTVGKPSGQSGS